MGALSTAPSEFVGCESGPCEESRRLFDELRVKIIPRNPSPSTSPVKTRAQRNSADRSGDTSPPRSRRESREIGGSTRAITLPQDSKTGKVATQKMEMTEAEKAGADARAAANADLQKPDRADAYIERSIMATRTVRGRRLARAE